MGHSCCHPEPAAASAASPAWRRVLWLALAVNAAMFALECGAGFAAGSVALLADAADFLGDAANYGLSLAVLAMSATARARAALVKGVTMGAWGAAVLVQTALAAAAGSNPEPLTMGAVGALALAANLGVALLLYRWRDGDANMRSVWLCTRNDAIGNLAVMAAALGVFGSGSAWPDRLVAAGMGLLALWAAASVVRQARGELRGEQPVPAAHPHDHDHDHDHDHHHHHHHRRHHH